MLKVILNQGEPKMLHSQKKFDPIHPPPLGELQLDVRLIREEML